MKTIGIDLGTTHSCVGVWINDKVEIIHNEQGNKITPSYVAFDSTRHLVGDAAKNQAAINPENTVFDAKRLIGRNFEDDKFKKDIKLWPFKVVDKKGSPKVEVKFKGKKTLYSPEEISSMVLLKMKEIAEVYLKEEVSNAVITVPAYFNNAQREATKDAGKIAGLNVLAILSEPTAAAMAYGLDKCKDGKKNVLIYDLGGGTFDVSIMAIMDGSKFDVQSISGDTNLGGGDFDNILVQYFADEIKNKHKKDITKDKRAMGRLRKETEKLKRALSSSIEAELNLEAFDGIDFQSKMSRVRFEELCCDLFKSTLKPVEQALADAKLEKSDIDDVVLVGGSTRIPKIQALIQDFFEGKTLTMNINADEAVAYGAAVYAASLSKEKMTHLPKIYLKDVTPLSLGVRLVGGLMSVIIPRNTTIPCNKSKVYVTIDDYQVSIKFKVFEGERELTKDNNLLGEFLLSGLPPAPAGVAQADVTFQLDRDGILIATAKEIGSQNSSELKIEMNKGRISQEEIKRLISDAKRFKDEDIIEKDKAVARSNFERCILKVRDAAVKAKFAESDKSAIISLCQKNFKWLETCVSATQNDYKQKLIKFQKDCEPLIDVQYLSIALSPSK